MSSALTLNPTNERDPTTASLDPGWIPSNSSADTHNFLRDMTRTSLKNTSRSHLHGKEGRCHFHDTVSEVLAGVAIATWMRTVIMYKLPKLNHAAMKGPNTAIDIRCFIGRSWNGLSEPGNRNTPRDKTNPIERLSTRSTISAVSVRISQTSRLAKRETRLATSQTAPTRLYGCGQLIDLDVPIDTDIRTRNPTTSLLTLRTTRSQTQDGRTLFL